MSVALATPLEELRRTERLTMWTRWATVGWALVQVITHDPPVPYPPRVRDAALALPLATATLNVVVWVVYRRVRTSAQARALAVASLSLDVAAVSAFVWLYAFNPDSAIWAALYLLPLEGAFRFRLVGALATGVAMTVLYVGREIWAADRYGLPLEWNGVSFRMGIGLLIALAAGLMARDLYRERIRLAAAFTQLRRIDGFRSALVSSLATDTRSPVVIILVEAAAKAVDGVRSRVRLFLPGGGEHCEMWPPDSTDTGDFDRVEPVVYQGEVVGDISVAKGTGQPLSESEEQLLAGLASQAGLALRNLRLVAQLEETVAELRASRQRIVTAQDRERRRMERDIHDGAQQQLVAIAVNLGLAQQMVSDAPDAAVEILASLKRDVGDALETLRDLARGLFPPLLIESGLAAALRAHLAKVRLEPTIDVDGVAGARFDPQVEAAVWFCCLEALQNASKHAPGAPVAVRLAVEAGWLEFSVTDHGPGFDTHHVERGSGLRNLADRIDSVGGHLELRSVPGEGTTITGRVPGRPPEQA